MSHIKVIPVPSRSLTPTIRHLVCRILHYDVIVKVIQCGYHLGRWYHLGTLVGITLAAGITLALDHLANQTPISRPMHFLYKVCYREYIILQLHRSLNFYGLDPENSENVVRNCPSMILARS